ncbi:MAG TPA: F0F1 ATP synthase subunit B [Thermomicrobiales bacterium]|nr:F0F1 ATP synthase subunit B [Thermomicrobiales bacterium]
MESLGIDLWKLVAQIAAFLVFLVIFWKFASKPLLKMLDERQARVQEGLEAAQKMQDQLQATAAKNDEVLAEARHQAQDILVQAREQGDAAIARAQEQAGKQADEYMARAQAALRAETEQARQQLRNEVADLAVLAAGNIVRKELDPKAQAKLIEDTLSEATAGAKGA